MSIFNSFLIASAKLLSGQWANTAILFIDGIVVTRALGVAAFGTWAVMQAIFATLGALLGFRMVEALTRHLIRAREEQDLPMQTQLLGAALTLDFLSTALTVLVGGFVGSFLSGVILSGAHFPNGSLLIYGISLLARSFSNTWTSVLRTERRFWRLAVVPVIGNTVRLVTITLLWWNNNLDISSLAMTYAFFACLIGLLQMKDILRWSVTQGLPRLRPIVFPWKYNELHSFWSFLRAGFLTSSLSGMVKNADVLILGYWRSEQEVGWYRLAKSLVGNLQSASAALGQTVFQDVSEWVERGQLQVALGFLRSSTLRLIPMFAVLYVVAALTMWFAIPVIYGQPFTPSRPMVLILFVGTWISSVLFWVNPLLLALEKLYAYVVILFLNTILTLILQFVLTPLYGAVGTAIALSSAWAFGHLFILIHLRNSLRL